MVLVETCGSDGGSWCRGSGGYGGGYCGGGGGRDEVTVTILGAGEGQVVAGGGRRTGGGG